MEHLDGGQRGEVDQSAALAWIWLEPIERERDEQSQSRRNADDRDRPKGLRYLAQGGSRGKNHGADSGNEQHHRQNEEYLIQHVTGAVA
jgi:hypothetical protein